MQYALRVDENLYPVRLSVKQPLGFDHFKAFIHHGSRIDSYFFLPMDQLGCLRACSNVTVFSLSAVKPLKGPPEAVRSILRKGLVRFPSRH